MARSKSFSIPGLSFSWKRALGITQTKQKNCKKNWNTDNNSRIERKIGKMILKSIFGM